MTASTGAAVGQVMDLLVTSCRVVTSAHGDAVGGCLVASVMPVGVGGHRIVLALGRASRTRALIAANCRLAIHVLAADDIETAHRFGRSITSQDDRFAGSLWHRGSAGVPLIIPLARATGLEAGHPARLDPTPDGGR